MRWKGASRLAGVLALAGSAALSGCGGNGGRTSAPPQSPSASPVRAPAATPTPVAKPPPTAKPAPRPKPPALIALPVAPADAGRRPQTEAMPRTGNAAFRHLITDIWLSVTSGNLSPARLAFFPEAAYEQVKQLADPGSDWEERLWHEYALDVAATHQVVGGDAQFVRVAVPVQYALWVPVGACFNNVGYWHVPGARVEYRKGGRLKSFGIASMISWRGVWYVVHLGGVHRDGPGGMVDQPASGLGVPGPPGGC